YKPVHRKVQPVPTYMPNPQAQAFIPIEISDVLSLPTHPLPLSDFIPTARLTQDRLDAILSTVPDGFLSSEEVALLVHIIDINQQAIAWTDSERGTFSRRYFPDYEIPTVEHVLWVNRPVPVPKALEDKVRTVLRSQEAAGKYEYS
ncbi:uncharacterized protein LAESUDRAFT_601146, partial [Laetiporus sulphureus 93-53]